MDRGCDKNCLVSMTTELCWCHREHSVFALMRQTGSFCPFTCVPSSRAPLLVSFITRARGGEAGAAACVFTLLQRWEGKLPLCAPMWDSADKFGKDWPPRLTDLHCRGKVKVTPHTHPSHRNTNRYAVAQWHQLMTSLFGCSGADPWI